MASPEKCGKKWRARYEDADGRLQSTPSFATKKAAMDYAHDEEAKVRAGMWIDPTAGKITFSDYFEHHCRTRSPRPTR